MSTATLAPPVEAIAPPVEAIITAIESLIASVITNLAREYQATQLAWHRARSDAFGRRHDDPEVRRELVEAEYLAERRYNAATRQLVSLVNGSGRRFTVDGWVYEPDASLTGRDIFIYEFDDPNRPF